ncbi:hypothetical protein [Streptomyces sp. NPDC005805]|uniref:hypothetical protein n=1 Tax=Streptomyces sp. NPDC005805 TaxID=3157068 RepID=UPI00340F0C66
MGDEEPPTLVGCYDAYTEAEANNWTVSVARARTLVTWSVSPVVFSPLAHSEGWSPPERAAQ